MDVKINRKPKTVEILEGNKVLKQEDLTDDRFKELMLELSGDRVDMLRTATKLFKIKSYKFKDVR